MATNYRLAKEFLNRLNTSVSQNVTDSVLGPRTTAYALKTLDEARVMRKMAGAKTEFFQEDHPYIHAGLQLSKAAVLGVMAGAALIGASGHALAQDAPKPVEKQEVKKPESTVQVQDGVKFNPAAYDAQHASVRLQSGLGDLKENSARYEGNFESVKSPVTGGFSYTTRSGKSFDIDPSINGGLTSDDVQNPGDFFNLSDKRNGSGILGVLNGRIYDGATLGAWFNSQRFKRDYDVDAFRNLTPDPADDPQITVAQKTSIDEALGLNGGRLSLVTEPFAFYGGAFRSRSTRHLRDEFTNTLTGSINTTAQDTQAEDEELKERGFMLGISYRALDNLVLGLEGWSVTGSRSFAFDNNISGTASSGSTTDDLDYVQILARARMQLAPWASIGAELGGRSANGVNVDGTDARSRVLGSLDAILTTGILSFSPMVGIEPVHGKAMFGATIGLVSDGYDAARARSLGDFNSLWRAEVAYGDPMITDGQRIIAMLDAAEGLARRADGGVYLSYFNRKALNENGVLKDFHEGYLSFGFGGGVVLEGHLRSLDSSTSGGGSVIWMLKRIGLPVYFQGGLESTHVKGGTSTQSSVFGGGISLDF
ncbi:MAG TPA: hypothetical protein VLJ21_00730 [Candidatus Binatia bacterium]|nr:hypothetical protein [Candidatus Binatia bacterium]